MVIYQSTLSSSSSSESSVAGNILSVISSTLLPSSGRGGSEISMPSDISSGLAVQRRSSAASLGRAALGWTTTVAISILLLQWIGNKDEKKTTPLDWITRMISQLWTDQPTQQGDEDVSSKNKTTKNKNDSQKASRKDRGFQPDSREEEKKDEGGSALTVVLNRGSCHCGSITFKLKPARHVRVTQSPQSGKLNYPTAKVPSNQMHLIKGKHLWNTYHVVSEDTGEIWAYSFCKQCAIHLLHATDADQSSLFVNLQCFNVDPNQTPAVGDNNKPATEVPVPADGETIDEITSVVSTVTAATQKSLLTTTTALPDYAFANPKSFIPQHTSSLATDGSEDTNSDAPVPAEPPRPRRRRNLELPPPSPRVTVTSQKLQSTSFPRGVVAYTPTSQVSSTASTPSAFAQPVVPVRGWPVVQTNDSSNDHDGDDEADQSISSHSVSHVDMDYFSTSTLDGNTAASTTVNSSASASSTSVDYNVTENRERLLYNMRKHLGSRK